MPDVKPDTPTDGLDAARGIATGLGISMIFWTFVLLAIFLPT